MAVFAEDVELRRCSPDHAVPDGLAAVAIRESESQGAAVEPRVLALTSILPPSKGRKECGGSRTRMISRRALVALGR